MKNPLGRPSDKQIQAIINLYRSLNMNFIPTLLPTTKMGCSTCIQLLMHRVEERNRKREEENI